MWFDFGRREGFPTQYDPNATPVTVDVLEAGFIAAFIILLLSFLISLPSTAWKTTIYRFIRVTVLLLIGLFLLLGNVGQEWEVGHIHSRTPYKAGSPVEINASIGIKIGLRSVNVTLKSEPTQELKNEIINYNERFSWTWDQGRFGFGPYAGHLQQEFRAAQFRGLPTPILWIVDYFVIDGEGFRFGRFYRIAGWYSHIMLWSAFTCWLLSLILFRTVICYGGYCLGICGILQLTANLLWLVIRNPNPLRIPFEDAVIETKFGFSYWITFFSGIFCIAIAVAIAVLEFKSDQWMYIFCGVDLSNNYDEIAYLTKKEELKLRNAKTLKFSHSTHEMEMAPINAENDDGDDDNEYIPVYIKHTLGPPVIRSNKPKIHMNM